MTMTGRVSGISENINLRERQSARQLSTYKKVYPLTSADLDV
jgi:hypothetical protein